MSVYSAIKKIAKERNVSIYHLEQVLDFSNGMISKWDKSTPSAMNLQKTADYLGVSTSFILNKSKGDKTNESIKSIR